MVLYCHLILVMSRYIDNKNSIISLSNPINVTTISVNNGTSDYNWETSIGATGNKNQIGPGLINMSDYTNFCSIIASAQYGISVINTPDPNNTPVSLGTGIVKEGLQMSNDFDPNGNVINRLLLSPSTNVMLLTETKNNNNPTFKITDTTKYVSISSTLLEFSNGINIQDLSCSSITSAGGDITLQTGGVGVLSLNSGDNTQITCGENFFVSTNPTTGTIQFTSPTPTYFNTATANTGDGSIYVDTLFSASGSMLNINAESNLNLTSVNNGVNITAPNGGITLDSNQTDINGAIVNLTATSSSVNISGPDIQLNSTNNINLTSNSANIVLDANVDINLLSNSGNIALTSAGTNNITSVGDLTLSAPDIFTNCQGLQFDAGTYINIVCNTGDITLDSSNAINMTAQNSSMSLNASTDITIQSNALGTINTNAPNSNSYGNALPICLNHFESGTWSYTLGNQVFQDVFSASPININLPPQFFAENTTYTSTRWQINFDMNCWNFVNAGDKGFAIYLSFLDSNGNPYDPFLYNQQTPYCKWDNPPGFNGTNSQFKSINWCDYVDFAGLVGSNNSNITLEMYIAGDNVFNNVDFKFKLGFTRIQRV